MNSLSRYINGQVINLYYFNKAVVKLTNKWILMEKIFMIYTFCGIYSLPLNYCYQTHHKLITDFISRYRLNITLQTASFRSIWLFFSHIYTEISRPVHYENVKTAFSTKVEFLGGSENLNSSGTDLSRTNLQK